MKIEEDRMSLQRQREPGRPGHLGGVDKKLTDKEERARLRDVREENRRIKYVSASTSSTSYGPLQEDSSSYSSKNMDSEDFPTLIESSEPGTSKSVMRKDFITPKLVVALDRCQLSMRDSMFILEAAIDALGYNFDEFPISKSSIQRIRTEKRKERAENIKIYFQNKVHDVVTLHSDGKLLPGLSARKSKEERLPIVTSYGLKEQLIAVPRLDNSTGKEQAQAFWKAILDWNFEDKVQILSCDTTASNTGRFNGACALLEQTFYREMLFFACRHHELVLKAVAAFRTGVRGARLVSRESRWPQNLFDVHRSAKPTVNLRHWVGRGGPQSSFTPVASY
ncbi:hypothetical protein AVEN_269479-1 [Araneus ventricosus]|nr:hypothetical protein AVEN_269479-1 [Araneus ventricosus]